MQNTSVALVMFRNEFYHVGLIAIEKLYSSEAKPRWPNNIKKSGENCVVLF